MIAAAYWGPRPRLNCHQLSPNKLPLRRNYLIEIATIL